MNNISDGIKWFKLIIQSSLGVDFEFKYINEKDGDFGNLSGAQFDSEKMGGYIYFEAQELLVTNYMIILKMRKL